MNQAGAPGTQRHGFVNRQPLARRLIKGMLYFARLLLCLWLAAFAASTVAQAAGSTAMMIAMAAEAGSQMAGCPDCDDEPADADGFACNVDCTSLWSGLPVDYPGYRPIVPSKDFGPAAAEDRPGRIGPPDPLPPKHFA